MHLDDNNNIIIELLGAELNENSKIIDISYKLFKNYVQHQFKNTECGMYCIHFIDRMLVSKASFHHIIIDAINDDNMNELRYSVPNYCTLYLVKITIFDTCLLQIKQLLFIPWAVS